VACSAAATAGAGWAAGACEAMGKLSRTKPGIDGGYSRYSRSKWTLKKPRKIFQIFDIPNHSTENDGHFPPKIAIEKWDIVFSTRLGVPHWFCKIPEWDEPSKCE